MEMGRAGEVGPSLDGELFFFSIYIFCFLFEFKARFEFQNFKLDAQTNSNMMQV